MADDFKFILNPLTQALVDADRKEREDKLPVVDGMSCGGCGCVTFNIFATGQVACAFCHELVAGLEVKFSIDGEVVQ